MTIVFPKHLFFKIGFQNTLSTDCTLQHNNRTIQVQLLLFLTILYWFNDHANVKP